MIENTKATNPKDTCGVRKAPISTVPMAVMLEVGVAMLEGARKYGRHNYRAAGVRASVYVDAAQRHLAQFWDFGEDFDTSSGAQLSHITKAIAGLTVLRDSMLMGNWVDDRPPPQDPELLNQMNRLAGEIIDAFPDSAAPILAQDGLNRAFEEIQQ